MKAELQQHWFWDFAFEKNSIDEIWFTSGWMNGLFKANLISGKAEFITQFDEEIDNDFMLFNYLLNLENVLVFCPDMAHKIYAFNCDKKELKSFELKNKEIQHKFSGVFQCKEKVYFTPWCYKAIVELDFETNSISEIKLPEERSDITFYRESFLVGDNIFTFSTNQNRVLKYNVINKKCDYIEIAIRDRLVYITQGENGTFLLLTENGEIYRLQPSNMKCLKIWELEASEIYDGGAITPLMIEQNGRLYIFSQKEAKISYIDLKDKNEFSYEIQENYHSNSLWAAYRRRWGFYKREEDGFWILNTKGNIFIKYNADGDIIHRINIKTDEEMRVNPFKYLKENRISEFALTYPYNSIYMLFKYLNSEDECKESKNVEVGKVIWEKVKWKL